MRQFLLATVSHEVTVTTLTLTDPTVSPHAAPLARHRCWGPTRGGPTRALRSSARWSVSMPRYAWPDLSISLLTCFARFFMFRGGDLFSGELIQTVQRCAEVEVPGFKPVDVFDSGILLFLERYSLYYALRPSPSGKPWWCCAPPPTKKIP